MADGRLPIQFVAAEQQREAVALGMWIFLATELMLFGGLFLGYAVYRTAFNEVWEAASGRLDVLLGTVNTAVLLTSSLCAALADGAMERRARRPALMLLASTVLLGCVFLGVKLHEYANEMRHDLLPLPWLDFEWGGPSPEAAELFFNFYFVMTGTHAVHLSIGLILLLIQLVAVWRWRRPAALERRVRVAALYWHFVDVMWVFLYPMLYLI